MKRTLLLLLLLLAVPPARSQDFLIRKEEIYSDIHAAEIQNSNNVYKEVLTQQGGQSISFTIDFSKETIDSLRIIISFKTNATATYTMKFENADAGIAPTISGTIGIVSLQRTSAWIYTGDQRRPQTFKLYARASTSTADLFIYYAAYQTMTRAPSTASRFYPEFQYPNRKMDHPRAQGPGKGLLWNNGGAPEALPVLPGAWTLITRHDGTATFLSPKTGFQIMEDFINGGNDGSYGWTSYQDGAAGSGSGQVSTLADANHFGIHEFKATTVGQYSGKHAGRTGTILGGAEIFFHALINIPTIADAGEDYIIRLGYFQANTNAEPTDGFYFTYDRAKNTTHWIMSTGAASSHTDTPTDFIVLTGWTELLAVCNAAANRIDFYIQHPIGGPGNNFLSYAGSVTATIPTAGIGPNMMITKIAGSTLRVFDIDYYHAQGTFTNPR